MKKLDLPDYTSNKPYYKVLSTHEELRKAIKDGGNVVAIDTETYYNPDNEGVIRFIEGSKNNVPFCLTATVKVDGEYVSYYIPEEEIPSCAPWLTDTEVTKILHNFHYDAHILMNIGITIMGHIWDTMIMIHLINEEQECIMPDGTVKESKALKNLAHHYLEEDATYYEKLIAEIRRTIAKNRDVNLGDVSYKDILHANFDAMKDYACSDTEYTYRLWELFLPRLTSQMLGKAYDIDVNATWAVIDMERNGIKIDTDYYMALEKELEDTIRSIDAEIKELGIPNELNINSADDIVEMFSLLGVTWKWFTEKESYQTNDTVLKGFKEGKPQELAQLILKRRDATKIKDTFISQMLFYKQHDGKVHPDFNVCPKDNSVGGTVTGRLSSSDPNLQNIPKSDDRIRKGVVPSEGYSLVSMDYSQQEYRLMAVYASDRTLTGIIKSGVDIHSGTAALMLNIPVEEAAKKQNRQIGKTLNFSLIYGTGKAHLAQMLGYDIDATLYNKAGFLLRTLGYKPWEDYPPVHELVKKHGITKEQDIVALEYYFSDHPKKALRDAQALKDKYFSQFPGVQQFIKDCNGRAKSRGYTLMWDGRRRHFKNPREQAYKATNACIQGGCGSITKIKLYECYEFLKEYESRVVNVIHDDITFEIRNGEEHLIPKLKEIMEDLQFALPFPVSVEISTTNWGEMEEYNVV